MKIGRNIYFYEGDTVDHPRKNYFGHYRGMASSNYLVIAGEVQSLVDSGIDMEETKNVAFPPPTRT